MSARSSVVLPIPPEFLARAARWAELRRWERRELGLELRRLGLSYAEIAAVIPVPKGTLSGWCRDLELAEHQRARLASLRPALLARREFGMRRRRAALERAERIRRAAREEARGLVSDPFWVAGVVAYWAEGSKRCNQVQFANSDPGMVRLFVAWASRYLGVDATRFRVQLHLHSGQEESERRAFWSTVAGLDER